jgi:hypothetical protein
LRPTPDVAEVARGYASLADPGRRAAFLATLRSVINVSGQRIDAGDRLYLAEGTGERAIRSFPSATASAHTPRSPAAVLRSSAASATFRNWRLRRGSSRFSNDS